MTEVQNKIFGQYSQKDKNLIKAELINIHTSLGISRDLTENNLEDLTNDTVATFPTLLLGDLRIAFRNNAAGLMQDSNFEIVDHFGSMNWTFVGKVLGRYKALKQQSKSMPPLPKPITHQLPEASNESKWKADYISMLEWILKDNGVVPPMGNFWQCFQYLKLTKRTEPTIDEYQFTVHVVNQWIEAEVGKLNYVNEKKDFRAQYEKKTDRFINKCREIYFIDWITTQLNDSKDKINWLNQELNSLTNSIE